MSEFAARIRRVRMKDGADITILRSKPGPDGQEDWRGALLRNAKAVVEQATDDDPLVGYVLVGLYRDGGTSVGFHYDFESKNAIPRMLLPAWIAEVLRRDLISKTEARHTFNEMFEWRDG